jgi:2'-5' RNA ligase
MEPSADQRKLRAFIALKTPPGWDEKLGELQHDLRTKFGSSQFRWVKPGQIHITLRFFGWLTTTQIEELKRRLPAIASAHPSFTLTCSGLGCFPNTRRPRVLWAGLAGDLSQAGALQTSITSATHHLGEPPEDRPFKPHLTLARLKEPDRRQITDLEHAISRGFQIDEPWRVDQFLLMQSHLSPQGSEYEIIATYRLS